MGREIITIQIGQCGNQIGRQFWSMALKEHAQYAKDGKFDDAMSTFFRNVDTRYEDPVDLPFNAGKTDIKSLKARAILVDMEQGVVSETLNGPIGELFDTRQLLTDISGSGNNWAHGHCMYGPKYRDGLLEQIRRTTEFCDSLQSFFLMHSLGGGTGSGLGTYILGLLADEYPDVYRFVNAVFPSEDDDVITSPYNSVLALEQLTEHADCVLPIDNGALMRMCNTANDKMHKTKKGLQEKASLITSGSEMKQCKNKNSEAFSDMNTIVAHLLTNLTSSVRFEGSLNVDLNEITTNLVPFPKLHYIQSSLSPLHTSKDYRMQPRRLDQLFTDAFQTNHQLLTSKPQQGTYLACALLVRGDIQISDVNRNIERMKPDIRMIHWNLEGFKIGICDFPPVGQPYSVLCLSNTTAIQHTFTKMKNRFLQLYKRKAHLHHYTNYMPIENFSNALHSIDSLLVNYDHLNQSTPSLESPSPYTLLNL